jgi:hypothetical protein
LISSADRHVTGRHSIGDWKEDGVTDLLFLVSRSEATPILTALMKACRRRDASWACFFTSAGVKTVADRDVLDLLTEADRAVVCEHSWQRFMEGAKCPAELGSQTDNSALAKDARIVVSL